MRLRIFWPPLLQRTKGPLIPVQFAVDNRTLANRKPLKLPQPLAEWNVEGSNSSATTLPEFDCTVLPSRERSREGGQESDRQNQLHHLPIHASAGLAPDLPPYPPAGNDFPPRRCHHRPAARGKCPLPAGET